MTPNCNKQMLQDFKDIVEIKQEELVGVRFKFTYYYGRVTKKLLHVAEYIPGEKEEGFRFGDGDKKDVVIVPVDVATKMSESFYFLNETNAGPIHVVREFFVPDDDYEDGTCRKVFTYDFCISADDDNVQSQLLVNYFRGQKGDAFTYDDFTSEQIESLKQPAIDAANRANDAAETALSAASRFTEDHDTAVADHKTATEDHSKYEQYDNAEIARNDAEIVRESNEATRQEAEKNREQIFDSSQAERQMTFEHTIEATVLQINQSYSSSEEKRNAAYLAKEAERDKRAEELISRIQLAVEKDGCLYLTDNN